MVDLAHHHVRREHLLRWHVLPPVQLIVGPRGSGKTWLLREVGVRLSLPVAIATIDTRQTGPDGLLMRLRDALARAGHQEAAHALTAPSDSPEASADALLAHLAASADPALLAVDDAGLLSAEAAELLARLAAGMTEPHSLLIAAQRLDSGLGRLRLLTSTLVVDDELAFDRNDATRLFNDKFRLRLTPRTIDQLLQATRGSAAQLAVAAHWFATIEEPLDRQDAIDYVISGNDATTASLTMLLSTLRRRDRRALVRMAALPWADERIAAAASAKTAVLDRLVEHALADRDGDRVYLSAPTATALRAQGSPANRRVVRRMAATFIEQGDLRRATRTVLDAGLEDHAASLLLSRPAVELRRLPAADLQDLVDRLPRDVVATHPRLLLLVARAWHNAGRPNERQEALTRAEALGDRIPQRLRMALEAERLLDRVGFDADFDARARRRCARMLEQIDPSARDVRARLLEAVAAIEIHGQGEDWVEHATWCLTTAIKSYLADDDPYGAAIARSKLAARVHLPSGRYDDAIDELDQVVADHTFERSLIAMALAHRSRAHAHRGRLVRANADIEEAARLARALGNPGIGAFTTRIRREIRAIDTTPIDGRVIAASSGPAEDHEAEVDVEIHVFDGFEVLVDGRLERPRKGLSSQLIKVLAVRGGHIHRREAARALWPDDDPSTTVNRVDALRTQSGLSVPIVDRDGDFLRFVPGVRVDTTTFEHLAREAQANNGRIEPVAARAALEHYGDLLPDDDAGWVTVARDRARQLALRLMAGLLADALARDDSAEAQRWERRARQIDPEGQLEALTAQSADSHGDDQPLN